MNVRGDERGKWMIMSAFGDTGKYRVAAKANLKLQEKRKLQKEQRKKERSNKAKNG